MTVVQLGDNNWWLLKFTEGENSISFGFSTQADARNAMSAATHVIKKLNADHGKNKETKEGNGVL